MNILKNKMQRRDFLRSLIRGGMVLPFASQFGLMNKAFAQETGGPKRFVQFFYPNGCDINRWHDYPTGSFASDALNSVDCPLRPLAPHVSNVLGLKGLDFDPAGKDQGVDGGHENAPRRVLSGGNYDERTIESHIANQLGVTPMYVGVHCNGGLTPFREQDGVSTVPEQNPQTYYDGNFKDKSGGGTEPSPENLQRRKILESLEESIDLLQANQLSAKEEQKLQVYDSSLAFYRDVLESDVDFAGFVRPTIGTGANDRIEPELAAIAQIDNIVMAFASDHTRVAGYQFVQINQDPIFQNFPSLNDWLGDYAFNGSRFDHNENQTHSASHQAGVSGNPSAHVLNAQTAWYNMMVADLVTKLKAIPDPVFTGSIFDNTVITIMSENGLGANHLNKNLGVYVVAGNNTGINTGQGIDLGGSVGPADLQFELANLFGLNWSGGYAQSVGAAGIQGLRS